MTNRRKTLLHKVREKEIDVDKRIKAKKEIECVIERKTE